MGVLFRPTTGGQYYFNNSGIGTGLNGLWPGTIPQCNKMYLSYWYNVDPALFPTSGGGDIIAIRQQPVGGLYNPIISVSHQRTSTNAYLAINFGDGSTPGVAFQSNTPILNYNGDWHQVMIAIDTYANYPAHTDFQYGNPFCVLHDGQTQVPMNWTGGTLAAGGLPTWQNSIVTIGYDVNSPLGGQPYAGGLDEIFFTPLWTINPFPTPDDNLSGYASNTTLPALAQGGHLIAVNPQIGNGDFDIGTPGATYITAGYIGDDGETVFLFPPAYMPGGYFYPNGGRTGLPKWGAPVIYLHGNDPHSFRLNHARYDSFKKWGGSQFPTSLFLISGAAGAIEPYSSPPRG